MSPRNEAVSGLLGAVEALHDPVDIEFVREFQASTIYRPVPPDFMNGVIRESLRLLARVWKAVLSGLIESPVLGPGAVQCPTWVFWGDRDGVFGRADQTELLSLIPRAKLYVFAGTGHDPQWEVPEEFSRVLIASLT